MGHGLADELEGAVTFAVEQEADYSATGEPIWARFNGGRDGTLWYYHELVAIFRERGNSPLIDELDRVVGAIERLIARRAAGK